LGTGITIPKLFIIFAMIINLFEDMELKDDNGIIFSL